MPTKLWYSLVHIPSENCNSNGYQCDRFIPVHSLLLNASLACVAAKGDRECLQAVVDVMQSAAFSGSTHGSGDIAMKMQTAQAVTLGRQLKEVLNARTNSGQTPLMLACAAG